MIGSIQTYIISITCILMMIGTIQTSISMTYILMMLGTIPTSILATNI